MVRTYYAYMRMYTLADSAKLGGPADQYQQGKRNLKADARREVGE